MSPQEIAINRLKMFHSLCDEYNRDGLQTMSPALLKVFHHSTQEVFEMFKDLHKREPCQASWAYLIFCGKLLLRFSYLREYGRKETKRPQIILGTFCLETGKDFTMFISCNTL